MEKGKSFDISQEEVMQAFSRVRSNGGGPGIDGVTVEDYEKNLEANIYKLWNRMASGTYFPKAVRAQETPKKDGSIRTLGIPTIEDRVAQTVIKNRLEPIVDPEFYPNSYGYRPGKHPNDAVAQARQRCWDKPWVISMDIKGLFDNINHEMTLDALRMHTLEKWILLYTERCMRAPMKHSDNTIEQRTSGTPQGGVISAVIANLFMHYAFDSWITRNYPKCPWERYADDALIHCDTLDEATRVLEALGKRMEACKLELHPVKTRIIYCRSYKYKGDYHSTSFDFLGYTFKPRSFRNNNGTYSEVFTPAISKDSAKKFREKVRSVMSKCAAWTFEDVVAELNPVVRGACNYYRQYRPSEMTKELEYVNYLIALWVRRNLKRVKRSLRRANRYLAIKARYQPELFHHWFLGVKPNGSNGKSRMTGDCHVRICERLGV